MKDRTRDEAEGLKARQAVGNLKRAAREVRGDAQAEADRTKRELERAARNLR
jgi:hypothetical protein